MKIVLVLLLVLVIEPWQFEDEDEDENDEDSENWSAWQDSHLQPFRFERNASSLGYTRKTGDK